MNLPPRARRSPAVSFGGGRPPHFFSPGEGYMARYAQPPVADDQALVKKEVSSLSPEAASYPSGRPQVW